MNNMNNAIATVELKSYDAPTLLLVETDQNDVLTYSAGDTPSVSWWDW